MADKFQDENSRKQQIEASNIANNQNLQSTNLKSGLVKKTPAEQTSSPVKLDQANHDLQERKRLEEEGLNYQLLEHYQHALAHLAETMVQTVHENEAALYEYKHHLHLIREEVEAVELEEEFVEQEEKEVHHHLEELEHDAEDKKHEHEHDLLLEEIEHSHQGKSHSKDIKDETTDTTQAPPSGNKAVVKERTTDKKARP